MLRFDLELKSDEQPIHDRVLTSALKTTSSYITLIGILDINKCDLNITVMPMPLVIISMMVSTAFATLDALRMAHFVNVNFAIVIKLEMLIYHNW